MCGFILPITINSTIFCKQKKKDDEGTTTNKN